jgi:hypothetical protein
MDAEIEFAEKEEDLENQIEKLRLEKEAALMSGLKDKQIALKDSVFENLHRFYEGQPLV